MDDQWNQNPGGQQTPAADPVGGANPTDPGAGNQQPWTPNPVGGGGGAPAQDPAQTPSKNWSPEPPAQTPTPEPSPTPAPTPEPNSGGGLPASDSGTGAPTGGWNQGDQG